MCMSKLPYYYLALVILLNIIHSFVQLNGSNFEILIIQINISYFFAHSFKYRKWLNISILFINWILTSTTTPGQSEPGSNSHERVLHIPQNLKTGASPSDAVGVISQTLIEAGWGPTSLQRCS